MRRFCRLVLMPVICLWAGVAQGQVLWFSDRPPGPEWAERVGRSHGGPIERGRKGVHMKRLWLMQGSRPNLSSHSSFREGELRVNGPGDAPVEPKTFSAKHGGGLVFAMPEEGFYNAYLVDKRLAGDTLETSVVKAEVLRHSCGEGHDPKLTASRMPPRRADDLPLELVRERLPGEDFHTRIAWGDHVRFRVYHRGEPLPGARVTFSTREGWAKTVLSDGDGAATFEVIRDYYPRWSAFEKRHSETYLVSAEYVVAEPGEWNGKPYRATRYTASMPGAFHPSEREYASYLYGLIVALVAAAVAAGGVFYFRMKQARWVRERFDEKA